MAGDLFDSERTQRALLGSDLVDAASGGLGGAGTVFRTFQRRYRDDPAGFAR